VRPWDDSRGHRNRWAARAAARDGSRLGPRLLLLQAHIERCSRGCCSKDSTLRSASRGRGAVTAGGQHLRWRGQGIPELATSMRSSIPPPADLGHGLRSAPGFASTASKSASRDPSLRAVREASCEMPVRDPVIVLPINRITRSLRSAFGRDPHTLPLRRCVHHLSLPAGVMQRTLRDVARDEAHLEVVAARSRGCNISTHEGE
jgi:hypothetical protein